MIDKIATLRNLHSEFPRYLLDTMLKIIDCIVETDDKQEDGILLTKKNTKDITSHNLKILYNDD